MKIRSDKFAQMLCEYLGLDIQDVYHIEIILHVGEVARVYTKQYVKSDSVEKFLESVSNEYIIVPRAEIK